MEERPEEYYLFAGAAMFSNFTERSTFPVNCLSRSKAEAVGMAIEWIRKAHPNNYDYAAVMTQVSDKFVLDAATGIAARMIKAE